MSDITVDNIQIEIEATADKAISSINKLKNALNGMKNATSNLDFSGLRRMVTALNSMSISQDNANGLKAMGDGIRSISTSAKNLASLDTGKLNEVADALSKIGQSMQGIGSNNNIRIRVDSEGMKKISESSVDANVAQNMQNAANAADQLGSATQTASIGMERLSMAEGEVTSTTQMTYQAWQNFINTLGSTGGSTEANAVIDDLIAKMREYQQTISDMQTGKTPFDFDKFSEATQGLETAKEQLEDVRKAAEGMPKTVGDVANEFQRIGESAQKSGLSGLGSVFQDVGQYMTAILPAGEAAESGLMMVATGLEAVEAAIPIVGLVLAGIKTVGRVATSVANGIKDEVQGTVEGITEIIKSKIEEVKETLTTIGKIVGSVFDDIKKKVAEQGKIFDGIEKALGKVSRLFVFMALRRMITSVFSGLQEGFNLLAQYSDMMGTRFNQNVSLIVADLQWLSNSMVAAFEPILNVITPILDFLISKLVEAINAINQFFSALTGSAVWTRAKRNVQNYAGGLQQGASAAKQMKKEIDNLTVGIDELNILQQDDDRNPASGGGGGGGVNPADYFETEEVSQEWKDWAERIKEAWEKADFTEIGKILGDKLAEALANIPWDKIKTVARKLGQSLATLINGFIQGEFDGVSVSRWLGRTLSEAINTAFEFLNSFVRSIDGYGLGLAVSDFIVGALERLDWQLIDNAIRGVGRQIAQFFGGLFSRPNVFADLGTAISNGINAAIHGAYEFVVNLSATNAFANFGSAIGKGLYNAITGIDFNTLVDALVTGLKGVAAAVSSFAKDLKLNEIVADIVSAINKALHNIPWNDIQKAANDVGAEIGKAIQTAIDPDTGLDWKAMGSTALKGITTMFAAVGRALGEIDFKDLGNALANWINGAIEEVANNLDTYVDTINKVVRGIRDFVDTVLHKVDWVKLMATVGELLASIDWGAILQTCFEVFAAKWTFQHMFAGVSFVAIGLGIAKDLLSGLMDGVGAIGEMLGIPFAKEMAEMGKAAMGALDEAIAAEQSKVENTAEQAGNGIANAFTDSDKGNLNEDNFGNIAKDIMNGLSEGVDSLSGAVERQMQNTAGDINKAFTDPDKGDVNKKHYENVAVDSLTGFNETINSKSGESQGSVTSWADKIKKYFSDATYGAINKVTFDGYADETTGAYNAGVATRETNSQNPVTSWAGKIKDYFTNMTYGAINKTTFDNYASDSTSGYNTGVATRETNSQTPVTSWAGKIKDYFTNMTYGAINRSTFDTYASDSTSGYNSGISTREGFSNSPMTGWASWIKTYFTGAAYGNINKTQFGTYGADSVSGYNKGVTDNTSSVKSPMTTLASTAHSAMSGWNADGVSGGLKASFEKIGENIILGVIEGLANQTLIGQLLTAAAGLIAKAFGSMEKEAESHSPSKRAERLAINIDEGLINGLENAKGQVISAASGVVDSMMSVMEVTPRVSVDTSAVRNYSPNLGTEFANATMSHRIQSEMALASAIQVDGSRVSDGIRAVIQEEISPLLTNIDTNTQRQADKKEVVNVEIGRKTVKDAVVSQTTADGFSFTPSFA